MISLTKMAARAYNQLRKARRQPDELTFLKQTPQGFVELGKLTKDWYAELAVDRATLENRLKVHIADDELMPCIYTSISMIGIEGKQHKAKVGPAPLGEPAVWIIDVLPAGEG